MPLLERQDGVPFAVYTYREVVLAKKASLLKQEFLLLSEDHGGYARIFVTPAGDYEAVFSKDTGYLLGETVWDYFSKPYDFIFCEALPDNENVILVIVRAGSVYLDAKLSLGHLQDELLALEAGTNVYDIFISGNVPIAEHPEEGKFAFQPSFVKSFTVLDKPLFPDLPVDDDLKLIPISYAISELQIGGEKTPIYTVVIVVILGILAALYFLWPEKEVKAPVQVVKPKRVDPYLQYKRALITPAPSQILMELVKTLREMYTVPGWEPTNIEVSEQRFLVTLKTIGGSAELLLAWVHDNHYEAKLESGKAVLVIPLLVYNRPVPNKIDKARSTLSQLYDHLKLINPNMLIKINDAQPMNNFVEIEMNLAFSGLTNETMLLIAQELEHQPVIFTSCVMTVNKGLLAGTLVIKVIGATS